MLRKLLFILFLILATPVFAKQDIAKIYITGNIDNMVDKKDVRTVKVAFKSSDINFESYATLKLQGASSLEYPKKNYNINFFKDKNLEDKYKVNFKWGNYSKYTLKANWLDPTHTRNLVASDIAGDINAKYGYFKGTPNNGVIDGFPLEVYVNGKFYGIYTLNLHKEYMFDDGSGRDYILISTDGDFFFMYDSVVEDGNWSNFEVEVGEENDETLAKLNRLLTFINTSTGDEFKRDLEKYFDLDSLINYYCYVRYADLIDSVSNNLFFLTYDGEIWYTVFYDLDISFGYTWFENNHYDDDRAYYMDSLKLWRKLAWFYPDHIAVRYEELRNDIFTNEYINNKFYEFYKLIPESSFQLENQKWLNRPVYKIETVDEFLNKRTPVIDKVINNLKTDNYDEVYKEFSKYDLDSKDNNNKQGIKVIVVIICCILLMSLILIGALVSRRRKLNSKVLNM